MKVGPVLILVLVISNIAHSQAGQHGQSGSAAQGSLTVTATVESSVWLVDPDGKREIHVANAPDPKESFSHSRSPKRKSAAPAAVKQTAKTKEPARQDDAAVQFTFPTGSQQLDVTKKTVVMDVSEGGKTERRTVIVTTVVAQ